MRPIWIRSARLTGNNTARNKNSAEPDIGSAFFMSIKLYFTEAADCESAEGSAFTDTSGGKILRRNALPHPAVCGKARLCPCSSGCRSWTSSLDSDEIPNKILFPYGAGLLLWKVIQPALPAKAMIRLHEAVHRVDEAAEELHAADAERAGGGVGFPIQPSLWARLPYQN